MLTILFLVLTAIFGGLVWQTVTMKQNSYLVLLWLVLIGLFYDNLIIGIGRFVGEGALLETLSVGRFWIHALLTPTMIIFGFGVLRRAGISWAQGRTAHIIVCVVATLLILLGAYSDILRLDLYSTPSADILRYRNEGGLPGPPLPAIVTILFLIGYGVSLWRNRSWPWLAVGAMLMFAAAGLGMGERFYIANIGELILSLGNVYTARKFLT
ncbi:MAG: hypothetical protein KA314_16445 [Chloroflexi bacterium]|nr:hypothetical protein [Chloroflexota bacterium]MBP8057423.1 hypothetical protein [Chloroflexota bacterium]